MQAISHSQRCEEARHEKADFDCGYIDGFGAYNLG